MGCQKNKAGFQKIFISQILFYCAITPRTIYKMCTQTAKKEPTN